MIILALVVAVSSIFLVYYFSTGLKKSNKFIPPGPRYIPFLNDLAEIRPGRKYYGKLAEWAHKYGKIYTLEVGNKRVFVVNDANLMRDLFGKMEATGREQLEIFRLLAWSGRYGMFLMEGNEWWEQRQFLARTLVQFGFGRGNRMEHLVLAETDKLCGWIDRENGRNSKCLVNPVVLQMMGNIIWAMFTGQTTEQMEPPKIIQLIDEYMKSMVQMLKAGYSVQPGERTMAEICKEIHEFVELCFEEHRESRVNGEPPRNMIDAYIDKVENCQDPASTFYGEKGWKNSWSNIAFTIFPGTDTTGAMITWILFYLSVHVQVQEELQQEIDDVVGRDRAPALSDKNKMPYMEAVTLEALRFASLIPFGSTNTLLEDVAIDGYRLPKGTEVCANRHFVHNDKRIWGDPENFRPARFLEDGSENLKNSVIAFHVGKRSCPGVFLAKDVMFLVVAKLLQTFTFSVDTDVENVRDYLEPIPAPMLKPRELALVIRHRK